jgi:predicted esterase
MGGIGVWHLTGKRSNPYTAAVIMAAQPPDLKVLDGWDMPMFIIHGKMDELFPVVETTKAVIELEQDGADLKYRILEGVSHFQVHKYHAVIDEVNAWLIEKWGI